MPTGRLTEAERAGLAERRKTVLREFRRAIDHPLPNTER